MDINVIIVEDELHSGKMLKEMVATLRPEWKIEALLQSVSETVEWLQQHEQPSIIFLDIELADGNCFSIFDQVQVDSGIIFTTAYNEFALKAFQTNSIDYLLKPIKEGDLLRSIEKVESAIEMITNNIQPDINYQQLASTILNSKKDYRQRFVISKRESFFKLSVEEIAYFYFDSRVTFAVTYDNKHHVLNQPLDKIELELDPKSFFRTNRQSIVNVEAIDRFETYFSGKLVVKLINDLNDKIIISRAKATLFKEWMNQ
ncbi:MAG: response regulator transcription factor [Marinilabiliaceae bacterium]|nr:response regulator transcription factor [Marinilabiliaceae bacterium]